MSKTDIDVLKQQEVDLLSEIDVLLNEVQGLLQLVEEKEQQVIDLREAVSSYSDNTESAVA